MGCGRRGGGWKRGWVAADVYENQNTVESTYQARRVHMAYRILRTGVKVQLGPVYCSTDGSSISSRQGNAMPHHQTRKNNHLLATIHAPLKWLLGTLRAGDLHGRLPDTKYSRLKNFMYLGPTTGKICVDSTTKNGKRKTNVHVLRFQARA